MGWAYSTTGAAPWPDCNAVTLGCGGPGAAVPLARGLAGIYDQTQWAGDPGMVSSPLEPGVVVSVNLARSAARQPGQNPDAVVASVSFDGGETFSVNAFVNDDFCIGWFEDQASIALERGVIGTNFVVTWRHRGTEVSPFGGCIRAGSVQLGGIRWATEPRPMPLRGDLFWGVGGMLPVARTGVVTVVYANTGQAANVCGGSVATGWRSITSLDGGKTWVRDRLIFLSPDQPTCVPSPTAPRRQAGGIRNFGFGIGDDGTMYAAFPDDGATGLRVFRSTDAADTWEEVFAQPAQQGEFVFFPTVAVDERGRVLVMYQTIDGGGQVRTWVLSGAAIWIGPELASGPFPTVAGAIRSLGDYNGIATFPAGAIGPSTATFFPTWTRTDGVISSVEGAFVSVLP